MILWVYHLGLHPRLLHDLLPGDLPRYRPTETLSEVHGGANEAALRQLLAEVRHVLRRGPTENLLGGFNLLPL